MAKLVDHPTSRHVREAIALLGDSIRVARIEQGLKMIEVAERAGISRALLRRIENGDPNTTIGAAFEAAAVVNVPLFDMERSRLGTLRRHQHDKLKLLPTVVRRYQGRAVKDDF